MAYGAVISQPISNSLSSSLAPPTTSGGLERLANLDQILIRKQINAFELVTGVEGKNVYHILDGQYHNLFTVTEESSFCERFCFKTNRGFILHVFQPSNAGPPQEIMTIERPFRCCTGCGCCADGSCRYPMYVRDVSGATIGIVRTRNYCCDPRFGVFDAHENPLYTIQGWACWCQAPCCTGDVNMPVITEGEITPVANVAKRWTEWARELATGAGELSLTFPVTMSTQHKTLLFSAVFLLEMIMFEKDRNQSQGPIL